MCFGVALSLRPCAHGYLRGAQLIQRITNSDLLLRMDRWCGEPVLPSPLVSPLGYFLFSNALQR